MLSRGQEAPRDGRVPLCCSRGQQGPSDSGRWSRFPGGSLGSPPKHRSSRGAGVWRGHPRAGGLLVRRRAEGPRGSLSTVPLLSDFLGVRAAELGQGEPLLKEEFLRSGPCLLPVLCSDGLWLDSKQPLGVPAALPSGSAPASSEALSSEGRTSQAPRGPPPPPHSTVPSLLCLPVGSFRWMRGTLLRLRCGPARDPVPAPWTHTV